MTTFIQGKKNIFETLFGNPIKWACQEEGGGAGLDRRETAQG